MPPPQDWPRNHEFPLRHFIPAAMQCACAAVGESLRRPRRVPEQQVVRPGNWSRCRHSSCRCRSGVAGNADAVVDAQLVGSIRGRCSLRYRSRSDTSSAELGSAGRVFRSRRSRLGRQGSLPRRTRRDAVPVAVASQALCRWGSRRIPACSQQPPARVPQRPSHVPGVQQPPTPRQTWLGAHVLSQMPQLSGSLARCIHLRKRSGRLGSIPLPQGCRRPDRSTSGRRSNVQGHSNCCRSMTRRPRNRSRRSIVHRAA